MVMAFLRSKEEERVIWMALVSRLVTTGLMAIQDGLFEDLSTSAHLQYYPCNTGNVHEYDSSPTVGYMERLVEEFVPWDGVYFMRIAQCGYESDQIFAFFPLLPWLMRGGGWLFGMVYRALYSVEEKETPMHLVRMVYGLTGVGISMVAFCGAALSLYRLGLLVVRNKSIVWLSTVLFCWNPASVFYSAVYTESLFAFCTWTGLVLLEQVQRIGDGRYWTCIVFFVLASLCRSNGTLAVWFLLHLYVSNMLRGYTPSILAKVKHGIMTCLGCACVCAPYIGMQVYGWMVFCRGQAQQPEWCQARFPSIYGYIQQKYWDVGFLHFYEKLIRLPFVVQSIPVIALSVSACWTWTFFSIQRACTLSLVPFDSASWYIDRVRGTKQRLEYTSCILEPRIGPFVYHLALMTAVATLVMHVNVATRFLSSSPLLFWYLAQRMLNGSALQQYLIWTWLFSYIAVGTLLFPNFYPWT
ncbi:GPI mannosyltransferase 2 [Picochlorum sp. SENEW3]|nr:GPI mannosyltransferase 2 [Picochlorum sp. SENEW3]WPT14529.1 GPI mannosyltransferase 2 [Picochlorum sp. SENEW3]